MPDTSRLDLKIKRLSRIEAACRAELKRAETESLRDPDRKKKHLRTVEKYEKRIEKLLPKIRRLRELRTRLRSRS